MFLSQEQVLLPAAPKSPKDNEQKTQEVTASLANAKEISVHAAVERVLSEWDIIFTLKELKTTEFFLSGKGVDSSFKGLWNEFIY